MKVCQDDASGGNPWDAKTGSAGCKEFQGATKIIVALRKCHGLRRPAPATVRDGKVQPPLRGAKVNPGYSRRFAAESGSRRFAAFLVRKKKFNLFDF